MDADETRIEAIGIEPGKICVRTPSGKVFEIVITQVNEGGAE